MTATAVIVVEGVLKQHTNDGVIPQGNRLYHGLKSTYKLALVSTRLDEEKVNHWLRVNGFTDHMYMIPARVTDPFEVGGTRLAQIQTLRAGGNVVELVIEPDPEVAAVLMQEGIPALNYLHPKYSRPEWRPDWNGASKPWDALVAEVERQEMIRARDLRPVQE